MSNLNAFLKDCEHSLGAENVTLVEETIKRYGEHTLPAADRPAVLVSGSGVNYYGDRGGEVLTETSGPGPAADSFLTRVVLAWEAATGAASEAGVRVCHIRTSMVLDASSGGRTTSAFHPTS